MIMRRVALAATGAVAAAGYLIYRLTTLERALAELRERLEQVERQARKALALTDGQQATVQPAAPHANATILSSTGSFLSVDDAEAHDGTAPEFVAASAAERPRPDAERPASAPPGVAELWTQADGLFDKSQHAETIELLGGTAPREPDDCERLWRIARALHGLSCVAGRDPSAKAEQKVLVAQAGEVVDRALQADPNHFAAHKWKGIIVSAASSLEGTKAAIERSVDVRAHFEKAVELNPNDPTSRHLLGLWHYEIASIGWLQKQAAKALFAEPPSSSHDAALELLLAAEALQPGFYKKNRLLIAKAQLKLGEKGEARRWLDAAIALPVANADDEAAHAEALALARTL